MLGFRCKPRGLLSEGQLTAVLMHTTVWVAEEQKDLDQGSLSRDGSREVEGNRTF